MRRIRKICCDVGGFSLIEFISVILMLGILAALAIPMFSTTPIDAEAAAQGMRADLRFVQQLALARNPANAGDIGITFSPSSNTYSITDPANVFSATRSLPGGLSLGTVTITGAPAANRLSYNKYGEPEFTGASATIQISAGADTKTLQVDRFTGFISIS